MTEFRRVLFRSLITHVRLHLLNADVNGARACRNTVKTQIDVVACMGNKKMADGTVTPAKWFITENCVHTIKELRKLRWATFNSKNLQNTMNPQEKIHKKDDHTFDSARYFFTLLPDPRPDAPGSLNPATKQVRSWQEELLWREQQEAAGNLLDLSGSSRNNIESMPHTTWDVVESYRELV